MSLLTGSASVTRFNVLSCPEEPDFEQREFSEIVPGSELRESVGFVPFEPGASYRVGNRRFAFRVRIDKLRADPTALQERHKGLLRSEMEMTGASFVGSKRRKELRHLAEEELLVNATPRSKIVEGCIDDRVLYVGSTAKADLGVVTTLLRQIEVRTEFKTPWIDRQEQELESDIVEAREPGESIRGCRFLKALLGDREIMFEPETGSVRLQTREARVLLSGSVLGDLHRYVERGAEVLAAKLVTAETRFRLEGMSYRIAGLKVQTERHDHWTELLDERLERIAEVWDLLDGKYRDLRPG